MHEYNQQNRQVIREAGDADCAQPLGQMARGSVGRILAVSGDEDVERGLLEIGFVEGAQIEVLHHGFLGRDPLAVRINHTMTVALRRCEANAVLVGPLHDVAVDARPVMSVEYASS